MKNQMNELSFVLLQKLNSREVFLKDKLLIIVVEKKYFSRKIIIKIETQRFLFET